MSRKAKIRARLLKIQQALQKEQENTYRDLIKRKIFRNFPASVKIEVLQMVGAKCLFFIIKIHGQKEQRDSLFEVIEIHPIILFSHGFIDPESETYWIGAPTLGNCSKSTFSGKIDVNNSNGNGCLVEVTLPNTSRLKYILPKNLMPQIIK